MQFKKIILLLYPKQNKMKINHHSLNVYFEKFKNGFIIFIDDVIIGNYITTSDTFYFNKTVSYNHMVAILQIHNELTILNKKK